MSSSADSFVNNPYVTRLTTQIARLQQENYFSKERLSSLKNHFLVTIGFFVLLYCLIQIQILFFWFLKLIFRLIFRIVSTIFWLPLTTVRLLIPKSIDYDILFPLFWLCSISSFYISKYSNENLCQFYDQQIVRRYKSLNYDQIKREDIKRYIFISTFLLLLILQSLFILLPIALSIRHQNEQSNVIVPTSTPISTTTTLQTETTTKTPGAKTAVKDVVETMGERLYNRFIDAFTDENETHTDGKRQPLVSDEQLENTFKTIKKTIQQKFSDSKSMDKSNDDKKTSRFQRWVVHYLKAPFKKWEKKIDKQENVNIEEKSLVNDQQGEEEDEDDDHDDHEQELDEEDAQEDFSSDEEDDDDDDDDEDVEKEISTLDDDEDEDEDEDEGDEDQLVTGNIKEQLSKPIDDLLQQINNKNDESDDDDHDDEEEESVTDQIKESLQNVETRLKNQLSSSDDQNEESDEEESITDQIKEKLAKSFGNDQTSKDNDSGYESEEEDGDNDDDDEESTQIFQKIKENLVEPIEKVQDVATDIKNKITSSIDDDEEDNGDDEDLETFTEKVKEHIAKPIESAKNLGEQVVNNLKTKLSSSDTDEEDLKIETDVEGESVLSRIKENVIEPIETVATNLRDKLPTLSETEEIHVDQESLLDKAKHTVEKITTPIKDKIVEGADELKHKAEDLVHSAEDFASNLVEKSSEYLKEKGKQIKNKLPQPSKLTSKIHHDIVEPIEKKITQTKKLIRKKTNNLQKQVRNKIKSIKKNKKVKYLTNQVEDKLHTLSEAIQERLPERFRKKKKLDKKTILFNKIKSALQLQTRINGLYDEAWNIWHLAKRRLSHIFISSTKHARHLPRHNITSIYTAYTDVKCFDYTKNINRYRSGKRKYIHFIDTYRHHSPFPVYLSVLKTNGPRCYRQYPDSSCGLITKPPTRNFKLQLYRFVRFWALIGILVIIISVIYKNFAGQRRINPSTYRRRDNFDRSSPGKQQTTITKPSNVNDLSKPTTATTTTTVQRSTTINQQTVSSNQNNSTSTLNEEIKKQFQTWLEFEQNDGFRNLSETCRVAINNTFLKQLERLSVETLQFANAKIHNVSQNNNNNNTNTAAPAEKIVINGILDIDHLILNIVNTFKEQHFSLETQKLSGQLLVLLTVQSDLYSFEANLQKLQIKPVNIIDPNNALLPSEKQSIIKLLDETINQTIVRCSFRLSDIQENTNVGQSQNSNYNQTKTTPLSNQLSASSVQSYTSPPRQPTPSRYPQSESLPTVLINDTDPNLYTQNYSIGRESKRLLVRIVKAVKLHDVEQPYCILELNEPKQIHQTSIAKNGVNPFWDERFIFECDDKSNQIHLQVIDRKKNPKKHSDSYTDTVYADVSIPFSYITSTVYKQDVQISPQYPESILRIEFSTLSEEEALAANNGYDVESLTDSQTWTYNDREANKIEQDFAQRFQQQTSANDYLSSAFDSNTLPKHYGLSNSFYDDERDYASTLPRSPGHQSHSNTFSPTSYLSPHDGGLSGNDKPHKSKSFMSSLKHLTLPGRKHRNKDKNDNSMNSQASSTSQLNTSFQSPSNSVSHSLSTALPGPNPKEYFSGNTSGSAPIRRSRSISRSFKNLFRSSSKKKNNASKTDTSTDFENIDRQNFVPSSAPTTKKLSFLHRRKSKPKSKEQTNFSTNSLSSYDCSRLESVRDTPVRANVGHPVTMTKSLVH